ncbi:MAG: aerial mycelium formation protein [Actinomycetota bacterium]
MTEARRRIDIVLAPEFLDDLESRSGDDLDAMHAECQEIETEVSYVRRLAQARIEILTAEQQRRATGGSVADLIAALPTILADPGPRPEPSASRLSRFLAPSPDIQWTRGREPLIADDTLANLPTLGDETLAATLEDLRALEVEVSQRRRDLHGVIDRLESELARRRVSA